METVSCVMAEPLPGEKRNGIVQILIKSDKARIAERHTNPL
jgi:hypothetical protein